MSPVGCTRAMSVRRLPVIGLAVAALWLGTACGGGSSPPAPTQAPGAAASPSPGVVSTAVKPSLVPVTASPSPVGATAVATKPAATGGETYAVVSGDTLLTIAEKFYGDATLWRRIYDANTDVIGSNPDALQIDMKLRIPPKE